MNKIPKLESPNTEELDYIIQNLERRVMIIGRDQRTFSGIFNLKARVYFIYGFVLAIMLVIIAIFKL